MKLVQFPIKLRSEIVTVEVRTGAFAHNAVVRVDHGMTIHMKAVKFQVRCRNPISMQAFSVRGSIVRYVLLLDSLSL